MDDRVSAWRTSSYSGSGGGNCVEVSTSPRVVFVRDSKDREGVVLSVPVSAWRKLVGRLAKG